MTAVGANEAVPFTGRRAGNPGDAGLLAKQPYRQPRQRMRYEYVLTERGRDLYPILVSLIEFGRMLQGESPTMERIREGLRCPGHSLCTMHCGA